MQIDAGAKAILNRLEEAGYETYVVGGCVRDALLGLTPKDWDLTTSAKPQEIKALFDKTLDTGIEHGTVSVQSGRQFYEVTTYRIDGHYSDHRRPDAVAYTTLLYEDLARRDFTINAMAYHPRLGLIDYFDGQGDLKRKQIRCVGEAQKRFEEDALRMLRAIRFAVRLGFTVEEDTKRAICHQAEGLRYVSKERIADELTKALLCPNPEGLADIEKLGLLPYISQVVQPGEKLDFLAPGRVAVKKGLRFAALLSGMSAERAGSLIADLKMDNDTKHKVRHLLSFLRDELPEDGRSMRFFLHEVDKENFEDLCQLKEATNVGDAGKIKEARKLFEAEQNAPVTLRELAVSGRDLIEMGAEPGRHLGEILETLLQYVMEDPRSNEREKLLSYFRNM